MRLSRLIGSVVVCLPLSGASMQQCLGQGAWNGAWATLAPIPTPRHGSAVGEVDGVLYVVGGCCSGPAATVNEAYNPNTDTWALMASIPTGISQGGTNGAVVDGIMYVIGGNAGGFCTGANWAYSPVTNSWSPKVSMPTPRCHLAVVAVGGLIYAIGGTNTSGGVWYQSVEI